MTGRGMDMTGRGATGTDNDWRGRDRAIHSRSKDGAAFELHAGLPHTVRMVSRVEPLIDHPFEATRAEQIA